MELARFAPSPALVRQTAQRLLACNQTSARFGLALSPTEAEELARHRFEALQDTNRVEFGEGILPGLVSTFCDSPYLAPHNYADTLHELVDCFYHFKNQSYERISDEDLLMAMKRIFDGPAQGSLEYLQGTALEALCGALRNGCSALAPEDAPLGADEQKDTDEKEGWLVD